MDENQVVTHPEKSTASYSTGGWGLLCTRDRWHQQSTVYGNRAPEVPAGPSHIERQWGLQEKGKYGQVCNKKREGSCVCATRTSLKSLGSWWVRVASGICSLLSPVGATRWGRSHAAQHWGINSAVCEQGLAELQHNSKQWLWQLRGFTYSTVYTTVCFVTSLTPTDETNNRWILGILWNTDLEHLFLPSGLEVLGCLLLCLALLLLLCHPLHLGNLQSHTHLDLLSCSE